MTGLRLDLPNPDTCESPREYIEKHLAPALTELHRITNELLAPGATSAEEWAVDMGPKTTGKFFQRLDQPLYHPGKHVVFDGTEYFTLPKELLRSKQVKVQLTAVVYGKADDDCGSSVAFRLVRDDGVVIQNSDFFCHDQEPSTFTRTLPFGDATGSIAPGKRTYFLEGCSPFCQSMPVCRRMSLSFVYI